LQPNRLNDLIGKKANRSIAQGGFFYMSDIIGQTIKRNYKFNLKRLNQVIQLKSLLSLQLLN
jgi:hypothetical protein